MQNWSWATDVTWTVLPMYLLRFWTWEHFSCFAVYGGSDRSPISSKYHNMCSGDERRLYGFGTTWGWVINDIHFILGWTNPLTLDAQFQVCFTWRWLFMLFLRLTVYRIASLATANAKCYRNQSRVRFPGQRSNLAQRCRVYLECSKTVTYGVLFLLWCCLCRQETVAQVFGTKLELAAFIFM